MHADPKDDFKLQSKAICDQVGQNSLDAIAVTGDLINHTGNISAGPVALVAALTFINGLKPLLKDKCSENIFVVPGNHDVSSLLFQLPSEKEDDLDGLEPEYKELVSKLLNRDYSMVGSEINGLRFRFQENITDLTSRHEVVISGVHRLVRGRGMNIVLLNTECQYAPGMKKSPDFYEANINDIIEELRKPIYQGVPTIALGHRPDMDIESSMRFKEYLRKCGAIMYLCGHKHDCSVSMDRNVVDFISLKFGISSDDPPDMDTGFSLINWVGDSAEVVFYSFTKRKAWMEQPVMTYVHRPVFPTKYEKLYRCVMCDVVKAMNQDSKKCLIITGKKGSGKTTVLRNITNTLTEIHDPIYINATGMDRERLVERMLEALPNRFVQEIGYDGLVSAVERYTRTPVFLLDNLGKNVVDQDTYYLDRKLSRTDKALKHLSKEKGDGWSKETRRLVKDYLKKRKEDDAEDKERVRKTVNKLVVGLGRIRKKDMDPCLEAIRTAYRIDLECLKESNVSRIDGISDMLHNLKSKCPDVIIIGTRRENIDGFYCINMPDVSNDDLSVFFYDIFHEKVQLFSTVSTITEERSKVIDSWIDHEHPSPGDVVCMASLCAKYDYLFPKLESSCPTDPLKILMNEVQGASGYISLITLFLNSHNRQVLYRTLSDLHEDKQVRNLIDLGICEESNGYVSLVAGMESDYYRKFADYTLSFSYIKQVVCNDYVEEYCNVSVLLNNMLDDKHSYKLMQDHKTTLHEFIMKYRSDPNGMCLLLDRMNTMICKQKKPKLDGLLSRNSILTELAILEYRKGNLQLARVILTKICSGSSGEGICRSRIVLAGIYIRQHKCRKAKEILKKVKKQADVDSRMLYSRIHKMYGDAYFAQFRYKKSLKQYREAFKLTELGGDKFLRDTSMYTSRALIDLRIAANWDCITVSGFTDLFKKHVMVGFPSTVHIAVQIPRTGFYRDLIRRGGGGAADKNIFKTIGDVLLRDPASNKIRKSVFIEAEKQLMRGMFLDAMENYQKVDENDGFILGYLEKFKLDRSKGYNLASALRIHGIADCLLNLNILNKAIAGYREACSIYESIEGCGLDILYDAARIGLADSYRRSSNASAAYSLFTNIKEDIDDYSRRNWRAD